MASTNSRRTSTPRSTLACAAGSAAALTLAGLGGPVGCGTDSRTVQPLAPEAFVANPAEDRGIGNPLDRPGPVQYDNYRIVQPPARRGNGPDVTEVGKTVRDSVRSPAAEARRDAANLSNGAPAGQGDGGAAATPGTAGPSTAPADSSGGWIGLGSVLMEVNGTAIFSNKVLGAIEKPLSAEARKNGEARFQLIAEKLFRDELQVFQREELEYATAQRSLEAEDEQLARAMTIQWRQRKITDAGGSLEMARRRATADGWDFDKLVEQQYRLHLVQIYYQKRIIPLIQVSASDLRAYYELHKEADFTTHGRAKFRLIKIDPNDYPGQRAEAYQVAQDARKQATGGADFAEEARSLNKDPGLHASGGAVGGRDGFVEKGAFRVKEVEDAVWKLRPGEVTDVISADGAFYVAKLEQLTEDKVEDFDNLDVQDRIRDRLRAEQFSALRERHVRELEKDAIVRANDDMIRQTLESVIQRYPQWAAAK